MTKSVCFDVLGTCFGFDRAIEAIEKRLGEKLRSVGVDPKTLFFSWFYAAQRDFTYNSMVDNYVPIAQILSKTLRRACLIVDLPAAAVKDEDIAAVMASVKKLEARPALKSCFEGLVAHGWDVYGVTNGGKETSMAYYKAAGIALDGDHLLSCDDIKKAKPDPVVYENAKTILLGAGASDTERWFVAAHAWVNSPCPYHGEHEAHHGRTSSRRESRATRRHTSTLRSTIPSRMSLARSTSMPRASTICS